MKRYFKLLLATSTAVLVSCSHVTKKAENQSLQSLKDARIHQAAVNARSSVYLYYKAGAAHRKAVKSYRELQKASIQAQAFVTLAKMRVLNAEDEEEKQAAEIAYNKRIERARIFREKVLIAETLENEAMKALTRTSKAALKDTAALNKESAKKIKK